MDQAIEYITAHTDLDAKDVKVYVGMDLLWYVALVDSRGQLKPLTYGFEHPMDAAIEAVFVIKGDMK